MKRKNDKQTEEPPHDPNRPPDDFCEWWNPSGTDELSGASVGGHPDAERIWARPAAHGRFVRRTYGTTATLAWSAAIYRDEYYEWRRNGRPERNPFVSQCASLAKQAQFWRDLKSTLSKIGKAMPEPFAIDFDRRERVDE
jgi:hypothetical protein